jgi:hypothetical protein
MADDLDLDAELKAGDVLISPRNTRWTAIGWTPRGKLDMRSPEGTELACWWRYRADLPKGWKLERGGTWIR